MHPYFSYIVIYTANGVLCVDIKTFLVAVNEADDSEEDGEELGGLFRVSRPQNSKKVHSNALDCSRFHPDSGHNWDLEEVQ